MRILPSAIFSLLATTAMAEVPRVVTDIAPIHSLVAQVMKGVGTPDLLVDPGASPHGYALRPSQARALQQADLVIWVGEPLTPWLADVIEDIAADAEAVELLEEPGTLLLANRDVAVFDDHDHGDQGHDDHDDHDDHAHEDEHNHDDHVPHDDHDDHAEEDKHDDHDHEKEHGHEEHAHDDHDDHGHEEKDPHAWLDPVNGKQWLQAIAEHLAEADPDNAVTYQANASRAIEALSVQITSIQAQLAPHRDKAFIVFHDAYQYFETRFDLSATGAIRLGDATAPSAARLVELRNELADAQVVCAFSEPQYDDSLISAVAGEGVKHGILDPIGVSFTPGPALYSSIMDDLAASFEDCLN